MRKLLYASLYSLLVMISSILAGCNQPFKDNGIPNKTYEDFYEDLKNTAIEMEVIVKDKRAIFFYTNDENYFITTIKYENAQEFGFIYDLHNNILYTVDKGQITAEFTSLVAESQITSIFQSANYFFYLKFDTNKLVFQEKTTIINRECNKYRYEDTDKNLVYNIYIDTQTSLCLKCVCSNNDVTEAFFETKKFESSPNIENYTSLITQYNNNKLVEDNTNNSTTENENNTQ